MIHKWHIACFAAAFALLIAFIFILPDDPEASAYENRAMAGKPVLSAKGVLSGEYSNALEAYLSDRVADRTALLAFSELLGKAYGVRLGGATMVTIDDGGFGMGLLPDPLDDDLYMEHGGSAHIGSVDPPPAGDASAPVDESREPPGAADPDPPAANDDENEEIADTETDDEARNDGAEEPYAEAEGDANPEEPDENAVTGGPESPGSTDDEIAGSEENATGVASADDRVNVNLPFCVDIHNDPDAVLYSLFYIDGPSVNDYIRAVNSYRRDLPEDARIFCMLVPTKEEFLDEKYRANMSSQTELIQSIYDHLDPGIVCVDAYSALAARVADEYLYFRTDHHWTALGAYYAYLAFAESAGIIPFTINLYVEHSLGSFLGSLVYGTPSRNIREHPDTMYYYTIDTGMEFSRRLFRIPGSSGNLDYRMFMGGDYDKLDYTTSNTNGRTLVIIKDSYANALIPWVSPNYERIIVLDPRQYEGSVRRLMGGLPNADVLIFNSAPVPSLRGFVAKLDAVR